MADITMCLGNGCNVRNDCYRYTAKPTPGYQSYFAPELTANKRCEEFWDNKK